MSELSLFFLLIAFTGLAGYYLKSLSASGAFTAIAVGLSIYLGFGGKGLLLLGAFFATSSIWSKYKSALKAKMEDKLAKGSMRDWRQVLANGGTAAVASILYSIDQQPLWLLAFTVAIASANSDTWASEIGSLSKQNPINIRTLQRVERGTSGAVSLLGSLAALGGSLLIAVLSFLLFQLPLFQAIGLFLFGYFGNIVDTLLGAFMQQEYLCPYCGVKTEKKMHCQRSTIKIKGWRFIDNDMVNFLSGFLAVVIAWVFYY